MKDSTKRQDAEEAVEFFLQNLKRDSRCDKNSAASAVSDWMVLADESAINFQRRLDATKNVSLRITLVSILCLATSALLLHTPAPQALCPFAVFLMILFNDRQRKRSDVFHFASLRLVAETLRIIQAVRYKPVQLAMVLSSRNLSTHDVVSLSAQACEACKSVFKVDPIQEAEKPGQEAWSEWVSGQTEYYEKAAAREQRHGRRARMVFNTAFSFVGFVGVVAGLWSYINPAAMTSETFRIWMAAAAATGSCGLAYMSHVRDKKAFDQSFDYRHMIRVFKSEKMSEDSVLVNESINEHVRWALRMAGHLNTPS